MTHIMVLPVARDTMPYDLLEMAKKALYKWVRFLDPCVITNIDEWNELPNRAKDADVIMIFSGYLDNVEPLRRAKKPVILWSWTREEVLSMWSWENLTWLRENGVNVPVFVSLDDLRLYFKALIAYKSLRGSRILLLMAKRPSFIWGFDPVLKLMKDKLGITVSIKDRSLLRKAFYEVQYEEVKNMIEKVPYIHREISEQDLINSIRMYLALKKIINAEKLDGIGIDCLAEPFKTDKGLPVHPCLAFSLLEDSGIACGCEGDPLSIATMLLLMRFLNEPCFMTNIYPLSLAPAVAEHLGIPIHDFSPKRTVLLCHCAYLGVVPPSMTSKFELVMKWDKIHKGGVMIDAEVPSQYVTMVKLSPTFSTIQVILGKLLEVARFSALHCRAAGVVEVKDSVKVAEKLFSHHVVVLLGDKRKELKVLADAGNLKYEEL